MLATLAHRGPDDQFLVADARTAIGTRRLSIIDLDTGRQPLSNEDGSIVVSQNGEIYNYIELREELSAKGHTFRTKGDTETIAHLYEEYGDRLVERLRGMFAIALWDARQGRLLLARDRLGKKPLYWRLANGRLSYGSELKALLVDPSVERVVDRKALAEYLHYQYVPSPSSILKGIAKLPPASVLSWYGEEAHVERYWMPTYEPKVRRPLADDVERCLELLRESVRLRLRSDVPVGVFLSGGMDSSVVTALMAEASQTPVRSFSIGFERTSYDELSYARAVARHFGTDHVDAVVSLDAIELLPIIARHFDEPFGDSSAVPTLRVAQLAAREVKVVLTGDGGDEAFGGYLRYRFHARMLMLGRLPLPAQRLTAGLAQVLLSRTRAGSRIARRADTWRRLIEVAPDEQYDALMSIFRPDDLAAVLKGRTAAAQDGYLRRVLGESDGAGLDRLLRADTLTYLPEDLLVKVDRATMACSLEARAPLLDHHVVEFAARLPSDRKLRGGQSKVVLRQVAYRLMPRHLVERPKMGFAVPVADWFRGALGERFSELVLTPDSQSRDHLDLAPIAAMLRTHRAGQEDHAHRLWVILMFELWARTWLTSGVVGST